MPFVADTGQQRRRRIRTFVGVLVAVAVTLSLLALGLGTLTGSSSESTAGSGATSADAQLAPEAASARSNDAVSGSDTAGGTKVDTADLASLTLVDRSIIRTGAISLSTDDVAAARREVLSVTEQLGGYVADEQSRANRDGRLQSADLTLQVPTDDLDTAMERIGAAGTVTGRSQSARDVTEDVVDVDSRVASARASLKRVRLLLSRAVSLGDVIRLEQVLSSRQADLESLLSQQQSLAAQTVQATLRVDVSLPTHEPAPDEEESSGFLAGLSRGWHALGTGYLVLATVAGAILPTAVVLGVTTLLVWLVVRRLPWRRGTTRRRPA